MRTSRTGDHCRSCSVQVLVVADISTFNVGLIHYVISCLISRIDVNLVFDQRSVRVYK